MRNKGELSQRRSTVAKKMCKKAQVRREEVTSWTLNGKPMSTVVKFSSAKIVRTREILPEVFADFDRHGDIVAMEFMRPGDFTVAGGNSIVAGGKGRFYVHTCHDTGGVFICERGVDNNIAEIAEVFARNDNETVGDNAMFIANALNLFLAQARGH